MDKKTQSKSLWADALTRLKKNKASVVSFYFIVFVCLVALFAEYIAPHSFETQNIDHLLEGPSSKFLLGTDSLGRDILSRIIYGARMSMAVGIFTALISMFIGTIYGGLSGWVGGRTDAIMMGWVTLARVVRGQVLQVKELTFVEAAQALGSPGYKIMFKHVLPNILGPIIVLLTFQIPSNILIESFLSFIGLGLQPPYSSWGVLASDGWRSMRSFPHLILYPSIALGLTMLAFNLFGDGLRDAFDPKMKK